MKNEKNKFLSKRELLMQQQFLETEYKKRHFIINSKFEDHQEYLEVLFKLINSKKAGTYEFKQNLEHSILLLQHNAQGCVLTDEQLDNAIELMFREEKTFQNIRNGLLTPLSFVTSENPVLCLKNILKLEYIARREYNLPFHVLMVPLDMRIVINEFKLNGYAFNPIAPSSIDSSKYMDNCFFNTVFSYCDSEYAGQQFSEFEKEIILIKTKEMLDKKTNDLKLLPPIIACSNGEELSEYEFLILSNEIDLKLTSDMKKNSIISRLTGILFYDFMLALIEIKIGTKLDSFINIFHKELGQKKKTYYEENVKSKYSEMLKTASLCINNKKILATKNVGERIIPEAIKLPEFEFYHDYRELYAAYKKEYNR